MLDEKVSYEITNESVADIKNPSQDSNFFNTTNQLFYCCYITVVNS